MEKESKQSNHGDDNVMLMSSSVITIVIKSLHSTTRRHWDVFMILAPDINIQTYLLTYLLTYYQLNQIFNYYPHAVKFIEDI